MPRCHSPRRSALGTLLALATPLLGAPLMTGSAGLLASPPAFAQTARPVPISPMSLRGEATFGAPPELQLNGQVTRLSPAARIRGTSNTLVMSATLAGQSWVINYTLDGLTGTVLDVWLLTPEEASRRWPKTREEATTWTFDPITQSWSKP